MKYRFENEFSCSGEEVLRAMFEEGISELLLPDMDHVIEAETLEWKEDKGVITRKVRYLPVPVIKSVGPKKVNPKWMEWIEESTVYLGSGTVRYENVPTTPGVARLLKNRGEMRIRPLNDSKSTREVTGELKVEVFLLGSVAERVIHSYAQEILTDEARALARFLESTKDQGA